MSTARYYRRKLSSTRSNTSLVSNRPSERSKLPINLLSITRRFQWCMSVGTSTTWNIYLKIPLAFFFSSSMNTALFWRDPYRWKQKKLIRQKDRHVLLWIFILDFYKVSWESLRRSKRSPEIDGTWSLDWTKGYTRELATWGILFYLLTFYVFNLLELHFFFSCLSLVIRLDSKDRTKRINIIWLFFNNKKIDLACKK